MTLQYAKTTRKKLRELAGLVHECESVIKHTRLL